MNTRFLWGLVGVLAIIIVVLAIFLFSVPTADAPEIATTTPGETSTTTNATTSEQSPLARLVLVTSPRKGATVGHAFTVSGTAPGPWFSEAVFPIQVRDTNGNIVGRAQAQAQGEWQTEGPVTFTARMSIDATFKGPATLILLKDNPSGLPENDDAVELSITIQ